MVALLAATRANAITLADSTHFSVPRTFTVSPAIPRPIAGLRFSDDGTKLYAIGAADDTSSALYVMTVTRAAGTLQVTALGAPTKVFDGQNPDADPAGLDAGLEFAPGGTLFYTYFPAKFFAQRPGGVGGTQTATSVPSLVSLAGVTFSPHRTDPGTGFGRMQVSTGTTHNLYEIPLVPNGSTPGLFDVGSPPTPTLFAKLYRPGPPRVGGQSVHGIRYAPAGEFAGDLFYTSFTDREIWRVLIDPATGLPEGGSDTPDEDLFASGFTSPPHGIAFDPITTNELFVSTWDAASDAGNVVMQIAGFAATFGSTTTSTSSTTTTTSTTSSSTSTTSSSSTTSSTSTSSSSTSTSSSSTSTSSTSTTTTSSTSTSSSTSTTTSEPPSTTSTSSTTSTLDTTSTTNTTSSTVETTTSTTETSTSTTDTSTSTTETTSSSTDTTTSTTDTTTSTTDTTTSTSDTTTSSSSSSSSTTTETTSSSTSSTTSSTSSTTTSSSSTSTSTSSSTSSSSSSSTSSSTRSTTSTSSSTTTTTLPQVCDPTDPSSCDDGDPCTVDTCVEGARCDLEARLGVDGVVCTCERPSSPACARDQIPASIDRLARRACALFGQAVDAPAKRQRRRLMRGAKLLQQGMARAVRAGAFGRLSGDCIGVLLDGLRDARDRARQAAPTP